MSDKLSAAQAKMRDLMKDPHLAALVGKTFAEVLVESMDAKKEADHWRAAFEATQRQITVLAAVAMEKLKTKRLIISKTDYHRLVEEDLELMYETPDEDTRVYEIRPRRIQSAVEKALNERKRILRVS